MNSRWNEHAADILSLYAQGAGYTEIVASVVAKAKNPENSFTLAGLNSWLHRKICDGTLTKRPEKRNHKLGTSMFAPHEALIIRMYKWDRSHAEIMAALGKADPNTAFNLKGFRSYLGRLFLSGKLKHRGPYTRYTRLNTPGRRPHRRRVVAPPPVEAFKEVPLPEPFHEPPADPPALPPEPSPPPPAPDPQPETAPVRLEPRVRLSKTQICEWVEEVPEAPRAERWRYCDQPALLGGSYCPDHAERSTARGARARARAAEKESGATA